MKRLFILGMIVVGMLGSTGCADKKDSISEEQLNSLNQEASYEIIMGAYGISKLYEGEAAWEMANSFMVSDWIWAAPRRFVAIDEPEEIQLLSETIDTYKEDYSTDDINEYTDDIPTFVKVYSKNTAITEGYREILFVKDEDDVIICMRKETDEWTCDLAKGYGEWLQTVIDIKYTIYYPEVL